MTSFADVLPRLKGNDVYIHLSRDLPDWSASDTDVDLVVHFGGHRVTLPLSDREGSMYLASSLHHFVGERVVISWGLKEIFSFLLGRTGILLDPFESYDVGIISSYLGDYPARPESFSDAARLLKSCVRDPSWVKFQNFYRNVFLPLSTSALPAIETNCITDNRKKRCVHPTYVMEGQVNGRLKAVMVGENSFNPHSLGAEEKAYLRPSDYDEVFVCFDYRNMEVNVLQWLSGDDFLGSILESGGDIYKEIWRSVTMREASDSHRSLCKNVFLPVVFGLGKKTLAKKLDVSEEFASKLIDSLRKTFPVAFGWVESQCPDGNNVATDVFGRRRKFDPGQLYKIRNFVVQSPASMICLRKLVRLHEAVAECGRVGFHVHDGYYVLCKRSDVNDVFEIGTGVLEEEDDLFPGLKLRTTCHFGKNLDSLETLETGVKT